MRLLIDTHVLVWCDQRPNVVPSRLMAALLDLENDVFVSVASVWEIAIKRAVGKLQFPSPIAGSIETMGLELLSVTPDHAEHAGALPRHHDDPFDRMLIAQAVLEGMVLATSDRVMRRYDIPIIGLG